MQRLLIAGKPWRISATGLFMYRVVCGLVLSADCVNGRWSAYCDVLKIDSGYFFDSRESAAEWLTYEVKLFLQKALAEL